MSVVRRLAPHFVEKVWGSRHLSPWFPDSEQKIGEVWFEADEQTCPLLIKFLFTTEPLSVQVHPDDEYAARHENSRGKTEMWHILRAKPDAAVALGFRRVVSEVELRESATSGAIEQLLNWVRVQPGDTVFTPAGTVHAIGAGIALCEIQQRSDVTYRLYDYGRPRELHLDRSLDVAHRGVYDSEVDPAPSGPGMTRLVKSPFFTTVKLRVQGRLDLPSVEGSQETLIVLGGRGMVAGAPFQPGEAWRIETRTQPISLTSDEPAELLHTYYPTNPAC